MQHRRQARYCFYPKERFYLGTGKQYSVVQSARTRIPPTGRFVNQLEATIYDYERQEMSIVYMDGFYTTWREDYHDHCQWRFGIS